MSAPVSAAGVAPVASSPAASSAGGASLMPEPVTLAGPGVDAALGALYAVMSQQRQSALQLGQTRVQNAEEVQKQALQRQEAAEARAEANEAHHGGGFFDSVGKTLGDAAGDVVHGRLDQAASDGARDVSDAVHSPAFWNDLEKGALVVAKVAAVVASVAVTVASGGAGAFALAGAALLLSAGGEAVSATRCLGKDSDEVALGLEIGGAAAGGASGLLSAASTTADGTAAAVGTAAQAVSGGAHVVAGVAHGENATFAANAQLAEADATQAKHQSETMQRLTSWIVDDMKTDDESRQRGMEAVQGAVQANDQAAAAAIMPPVSLRG